MRILLVIFISGFVILAIPQLFVWSGKVIDKKTGKPLEGVVIVRSWDREYGTPAGTVGGHSAFVETLSDENGKFRVPGVFKISIPLFAEIVENRSIVFKPGYRFLSVSEKSSIIELERVPATYYVRHEEVEKVRDGYDLLGYYQTNLLKKVVEDEKETIRSLNKYVPGVLLTGFRTPIDIAIDQKNNVFVVDNGNIKMYPHIHKGRPIIMSGVGWSQEGIPILRDGTGSGSNSCMDIEVDRSENLYFFREGYLYEFNKYFQKVDPNVEMNRGNGMVVVSGKVMTYRNGVIGLPEFERNFCRLSRRLFNGLPPKAGRFTLGQNKMVYMIASDTLFGYSPEGKLLSNQRLSNKDSVPSEGDIRLIDIDSFSDGSIIVAYSYSRRYKDKFRNGVLIFDQNCNETFHKEIDMDSRVVSIASAESRVVLADRNSIYIYDKNINLISKEEMKYLELGEVDIRRISSDNSGTCLYLIEWRYKRILKYNLKTGNFVSVN